MCPSAPLGLISIHKSLSSSKTKTKFLIKMKSVSVLPEDPVAELEDEEVREEPYDPM